MMHLGRTSGGDGRRSGFALVVVLLVLLALLVLCAPFLLSARNADHRGSTALLVQSHCSWFKLVPQCGHNPRQSSLHMPYCGTASTTCSRIASDRSNSSPRAGSA